MPTTKCWNSLPPSWVVAYQALRYTWYWIYSGSQPHGFDSEAAVPLDVSSAPAVIFGGEEEEARQVNLEALRVSSCPYQNYPIIIALQKADFFHGIVVSSGGGGSFDWQ